MCKFITVKDNYGMKWKIPIGSLNSVSVTRDNMYIGYYEFSSDCYTIEITYQGGSAITITHLTSKAIDKIRDSLIRGNT